MTAVPRSAAYSGSLQAHHHTDSTKRPEDAATIHALTDTAFKGRPFSDGAEAKVIEALRAAGALTLSLVATQGGEIVGHVAFSPVTINDEAGGW